MTIALVTAALKAALSGVTATTSDSVALTVIAYDPPPVAMDSIKLPAAYIFTGSADYDTEASADQYMEARAYEVHCAIGAEAQMNENIRERHARALIPAIQARLMKYQNLGVAQVLYIRVTSDSGPIVLPEYGGLYVGFIINLTVNELITRTYATGE